ncbi:MAG: formate dehydrogenase accessory sulfurtransferase FdhD [Firmicutes bacterium]|nr:formate dehydrogenase accessory sulfurtransferase FdhD [Bacillota bacterium]
MKSYLDYEIKKVNKEEVLSTSDSIIKEYPYTIFINDNEFVTLLCTPESLDYLAVGFLFSEGMINNKEDILGINIDYDRGIAYLKIEKKNNITKKLQGKRTITTGCGKGTIFYNVLDSFKTKKINNNFTLKRENVIKLIEEFNKKSKLFLNTGGVHSCALSSKNEIIYFKEDIGRHNALDKVLGKSIMEDINLDEKLILTSGRVSSEIIIKVAKMNIPILISRSAPTSLAVDIANELGILLIGFARGKRLNIYSKYKNLII